MKKAISIITILIILFTSAVSGTKLCPNALCKGRGINDKYNYDDDLKYCGECATKLVKGYECPECGEYVAKGKYMCRHCGHKFKAGPKYNPALIIGAGALGVASIGIALGKSGEDNDDRNKGIIVGIIFLAVSLYFLIDEVSSSLEPNYPYIPDIGIEDINQIRLSW